MIALITVNFFILSLGNSVFGGPALRTAPEQCPLEDGNLLDVHLFLETESECRESCSKNPSCLFYYYYGGNEGNQNVDENSNEENELANKQYAQCFLYDACSRSVKKATPSCPINKENTVDVHAFVESEKECKTSCSEEDMCGYYSYNTDDDNKLCYHLRSCVPRVIRNLQCPLEKNNYIDHFLFTPTKEDCKNECEDHGECRFYYWYPIDYSPAPMYCYLFRSCEGGAHEMKVGVVAAGRHPGHYFLKDEATLDIVKGMSVCNQVNDVTSFGRAGAVSEYIGDKVLICGGRDLESEIRDDCLSYDPKTYAVETHSQLNYKREESASIHLNMETMYILGGIIDGQRTSSVEIWKDGDWTEGVELPESRSRFCAVALGDKGVVVILGGEKGENDEVNADMKIMNIESGEWTSQPDMTTGRKDHACAVVTIDDDEGILVSGGVTGSGTENLLDSVEFYSLKKESWETLAPLQRARTEHGMAVIAGLPTVMGGIAENEFLASIEILDDSVEDDAVLGRGWRIAAQKLTAPRYDFTLASIPISSLINDDKSMSKCHDDTNEVIEEK